MEDSKFDIYKERNLTMLVDFYELTMANGYLKNNMQNTEVVFDMFYRKNPENGGYVVFAGLEQFIEYIEGFHFGEEDIEYLKNTGLFNKDFLNFLRDFKMTATISAVPEGTIVYPNTPLITVRANIIEAQLIETMLLTTINHQSLIATKANRIVRAAKGAKVMEFGARRAQGYDAALYGARAAYIGGVDATATVLADIKFGVPAIGTMAHSWIQAFDDEYEAFENYAKTYPNNCSLLIDTYDVLKSGLPNAIKVAKKYLEPNGYRLASIRIDSGDLAYLSKKIRAILDENEMEDCKIIVSNSIDEYLIRSLISQDAKIDSYGVGERLITSKSSPVFGGVYKIVAVKKDNQYSPRIKISENVEKITNPGYKILYRCYDDEDKAMCDLIALHDEDIKEGQLIAVNPNNISYVKTYIMPKRIKKLHEDIFVEGKLVYKTPKLNEIRDYVKYQLDNEIWEEEQRFENPHIHYVNLTEKLSKLKTDLILKHKK